MACIHESTDHVVLRSVHIWCSIDGIPDFGVIIFPWAIISEKGCSSVSSDTALVEPRSYS